MYKQIKTVMSTSPYNFDQQVNADLQDGWELVKHMTIPTGGELCHYALLERYEMEEADKCCDNCKHCDKPVHMDPCCDCDDASHWEEVTT